MTLNLERAMEQMEVLRRVNPVLNPLELGELFPNYKSFHLHGKSYGLWSTSESLMRVTSSFMQQDGIILAISGIAAGGKDAIRETIEHLHPSLSFKAETATSRPPRPGEVEGRDYYFYKDVTEFMAAVARGEFVEWVSQGDRRYGMPKQSLLDALNRQEPVVTTHVEMASGWPAIDDLAHTGFFGKLKVFPLKVFVLPNMKFAEYANDWLPRRRDDVNTRLLRAAWEISEAATRADFIVTNTIGKDLTALEWESATLANLSSILLKDEVAHSQHLTWAPFDISPGVATPAQRLVYQASMLNNQV